MRNILEVIDKIINVIPKDDVNVSIPYFLRALNSVKESICYSAPELIQEKWYKLTNVINEFVSYPPKTEWQKKVAEIFTDAPVK